MSPKQRLRYHCVALAIFSALLASSAQAQEPLPAGQSPVPPPTTGQPSPEPATKQASTEPAPEPEPEKGFFSDIWTRKELTGDWGGARTWLRDEGIDIKIKVLNEVMINMHGGRETKNGHDFGGSYDLDFGFDLEKLLDIPDMYFWIRGKGQWGGDTSDFDPEKVGGLFRTNSDAGEDYTIFVDRWRWQQRLFDKKVEIWFGREELVKYYFDVSEVIGNEDNYFLNRALTVNPAIAPAKGLAFYANWDFAEHAYVRASALDAQSEPRQTNFNTAFHDENWWRFFAELGCKPTFETAGGPLPGHYRVGTWYDGNELQQYEDSLGGRRAPDFMRGGWGGYVGLDQQVWRESEDPKDSQGVIVAAKYASHSGEMNRIETGWAVGMKWTGLLPERDKDYWGFGVAQGIVSDESKDVNPLADRETVYELYYSIFVNPWLTVSPDFQYITNTGGDKNDPDTAVAGIRVKVSI